MAHAETLTRHPKIAILLHARKEFGAPSRELGKSQGHVGGDGTTAAQYRMQSLPTDAHATRRFRYGRARMLFDDLTHQLTWVAGRTMRGGGFFGHAASMVQTRKYPPPLSS
jgi:hypothetical protein